MVSGLTEFIFLMKKQIGKKKVLQDSFTIFSTMHLYVLIHININALKRSENDILLLITTTFRIRSAGVKLEAGVKTD